MDICLRERMLRNLTIFLSSVIGSCLTTSISAVLRYVGSAYCVTTRPASQTIFMLQVVHLTAHQVLDRLNALFEPGGELVISERGLDSNGLLTLHCNMLCFCISHTIALRVRSNLTTGFRSNMHYTSPPQFPGVYGHEQCQR